MGVTGGAGCSSHKRAPAIDLAWCDGEADHAEVMISPM